MAAEGTVLSVKWETAPESRAWSLLRVGLLTAVVTTPLLFGLAVLVAGPQTFAQWAFAVVFIGIVPAGLTIYHVVGRALDRNEPIALKFDPDGLVITYGNDVTEHATWKNVEICTFRLRAEGPYGQILMKLRHKRYGWERTFDERSARTILEWYRAGNAITP